MPVCNSLVLEVSSTEQIVASSLHYLDNVPIPIMASAPDLGIMINTSLEFHQYISDIKQKVNDVANNYSQE